MRRAFLLALTVVAGGCSHAQVQYSAGTSGGATFSNSSVYVQGGGGAAAALVAIGLAAAVVASQGLARSEPFERAEAPRSAPPGPLAPDRRINEQDCSRPIEDPGANLKCR